MSEYHPDNLSNIYGVDRTEGFFGPPSGPPFRYYNWRGVETKESKQLRNDYENYMKGWRDGVKSGQMKVKD